MLTKPQPATLGIMLLFILLPILAFSELLFDQQTLYWTDLTWIHYPRHIFAAGEWLAGRVPLWDPYEDTGIPLLAEAQVGVLYPLSVLFLSALSPSLELSLFILLHITLAAFFTFALARALSLSRAAATLAGLAYGGGGFLMGQVPNLNIMTGAVWLPLILYGLIETLRRRRWFVAMLAGVPLALQILTAQPQIVFYTLVIIVGYGLYRIIAEPQPRTPLRSILLVGLVILTGLLLAAPQLLPTFELQQLSVRSQERDLGFLTETSLRPIMLLNLLLPGLFGSNVTGFRGGDPFQEVFIYIGLIPLLLVPFSWGQRHRRDAFFFHLLLVASLLLALGRFTPLYEYLIQYLPGFSLFRIPARWLMGVNLALAILAGFGLEQLRQTGLSRRELLGLLGGGLVLLLALGAMWLLQAELLRWSEATLGEFRQRLFQTAIDRTFRLDETFRQARLFGGLLGLRVPALLLVVNLAGAMLLFSLLAMRRVTFNTLATGLILLTTLDLIAAGGTTINPTKPSHWWHQLSGGAAYVLDNVGEARVFPLGMGSEEATVSHLGQYFPSVYRVRSAGGHGSSLLSARYETFLDEADPVLAIQVVGVRYLLTLGQMGADVAATYPLAYRDGASFVYENETPLPRAFIVHEITPVDSPDAALPHLQNRSFDPAQTVVIEATHPPPPQPAAGSRAAITNEHPQLVEIEARLEAPGYLVLLDTYYPGWQATVDDQPTPIYPANYIGRAIFLPAGTHTVRFVYRPWSFRVGVGLFGLTCLAIGLAAFVDRQKG